MRHFVKLLLFPLMLLGASSLTACEEEIQRPEVTEPLMPDRGAEGTAGSIGDTEFTQLAVFNAGAGNESLYLLSIVTIHGMTRAILMSCAREVRMAARHGLLPPALQA